MHTAQPNLKRIFGAPQVVSSGVAVADTNKEYCVKLQRVSRPNLLLDLLLRYIITLSFVLKVSFCKIHLDRVHLIYTKCYSRCNWLFPVIYALSWGCILYIPLRAFHSSSASINTSADRTTTVVHSCFPLNQKSAAVQTSIWKWAWTISTQWIKLWWTCNHDCILIIDHTCCLLKVSQKLFLILTHLFLW